jgi:hypothetical protein
VLSFSIYKLGRVWFFTPVIPVLVSPRQEDQKFEAAWATQQDPASKTKATKNVECVYCE